MGKLVDYDYNLKILNFQNIIFYGTTVKKINTHIIQFKTPKILRLVGHGFL